MNSEISEISSPSRPFTSSRLHSSSASAAHRAHAPKILLFDHTAELGGGEIALLNLVHELQSSPFNIQVLLASPGPLVEKLTAIGASPHILPMDPSVIHTRKESLNSGGLLKLQKLASVSRYAATLAQFLRDHKIDLLHTNSLKSDIIGALAGRLARVPILWHVRDRITADYLPKPAVTLFRTLSKILPTVVVANSAATLATLPARQNAFVVHDGVPALPPLPAHIPLSTSSPLIGIVGRITRWKGQHIFLQSAADILKQFPTARFQIIGSALFDEKEYEAEIQSLTDSLGIRHAIEFTGFRPDVADLVAQMDIVVHASITGEPFGQVVIEAMAAARPVIATRGGGVPEIIIDNQSGLLIPMADAPALTRALASLLANPTHTREIALAGRDRVQEAFLIRHTAEKLIPIYTSTLRSAK